MPAWLAWLAEFQMTAAQLFLPTAELTLGA